MLGVVAAVEQVLFGAAIDWNAVDRKLTEAKDLEARITELREVITRAPDDPNGGGLNSSVTVQIACVSPRVNSVEPCTRGSRPTSMLIGRTVT